MIFDDLQTSLIEVAEEMTGEKKDHRFKCWARRIESVDPSGANGFAFKGEWVNDGTVEMDGPAIFLVMFRHGSRRYNYGEYAVVKMGAGGELHATAVMTDDSKHGWALRIRDDLRALVEELNV